ncbi:hypothetical protein KIW84_020758 [Lathyrus oleraceus]|uniref:GRF-type domain-containing protein n=1 Tax=Pisum sativum TaxID=3888 RepID=A0A9D4YBI2_PEA|nr:hypothetical protein KIW84_020758 [Pisum sativum]
MSQLSVFSHGSRSSNRLRYVCKCSLDAQLITTRTNANPGRRFYGCGMYKIQGYKKCSHFIWLDEEMNPRTKKLIYTLLKNINEENVKVKSYKAKGRIEDESEDVEETVEDKLDVVI